jgi:hypothetical protein
LRLLIFFPSITFGLSTTEVFPYAGLYSAVTLKRLRLGLFLILGLLFVSILYGTYRHNSFEFIEVFRSLLAYLNPLLVFIAILRVSRRELWLLHKMTISLLYFLFILGLLQLSGLISILDGIFSALVPRSSAEGMGFRGVTLLSTEPARAGIELAFLYFYARRFYIPYNKRLMYDLIALAYSLLVFKSATVFFLLMSFLSIAHFRIALITFPILIILIGLAINFFDNRIIQLLNDIWQLPIDESLWLIMNTSGNRVISIYAAVVYAMHNFFGGGIGFWKISSVEAIELTNIDYMSLNYFKLILAETGSLSYRCSGYLTNLLMDTGFGGIASVLIYLLSEIRKSTGSLWNLIRKEPAFFVIFLLNISIVGSVGAPVPWVIAAIYLRALAFEAKS